MLSIKSFLFAATLLSQSSLSLAAPLSSCPSPQAGQGFDYVIVGGGTAGLVLANRLTEDRHIRVAVVEAGTFPEDVAGNWTQVPGHAGNFIVGAPEMAWGFHTTPQSGAEGHSYPYYRAKALGGCSTINYMAYAYTSRGAHQMWADQVDDESYTFDNMLEYYHRTMNFSPPDLEARFANSTPQYDEIDTASGGGLDITYASYAQSWSTWLAEGLEAIGIPRANHFIDGNLMGQSWQMSSITRENGFRSSSQSAYLRPILNRPNLAVFTSNLVKQIIFDKKKRATGVRIATNGRQCSINARREVIPSAGVFQSPQLLMLSGVGPAAVLKGVKIPIIADRPGVGQNLEDHITVPISYQVNIITNSALSNPNFLARAIEDFNSNATGLLASPGGDYMAMEKIPEDMRHEFSSETVEALSMLPDDWPEISFSVYPNGIPRAIGEPLISGANYATLLATLIAPQSRGSISINSTRMADPPLIDLGIFTAQADQELLMAAFKRGRQALQTSAMTPVLIGEEFLPGPDVQSDEDIHEYIVHSLNPLFHAFASNKMGRRSDPMAVVDTHGRVIGVENLRVVDSSSFPFLPPGPAPQIQVCEILVLPLRYAEELRRMPEEIVSVNAANEQTFEGKHVGISPDNPLMVHVVKGDLTQSLPRLVQRLSNAVNDAIVDGIGPCDDWKEVNIHQSLLRIVAVVSGNIFLGPELSKREDYLHSSINFTTDLFIAIAALKRWPTYLRSWAKFWVPQLKTVDEHRRRVRDFLVPVIRERRKLQESGDEEPDDILTWLLEKSKQFELTTDEELAETLLVLGMAAIHTTTMAATHM
ncbi:hypothetical protein S40288_08485 [Stachybotrys chartarum IBT 40288]|nr:hypothetical protein S40288_08485 [Stachybotrys chartarum IBT 40288]